MISVDYKGDIYPCIRYMESSLGADVPPVIIGNVYEGIMHTKECKDCVACMRAITRITESTEECINCPIAEGCAECAAYNYQDCGGHWNHRATYICIMHKARILANCYYWNMKYWKQGDLKRFKLWLSDEEALKIISQEELEILKALQFPLE
jgi:radical SAM protein with 4Fe4S-binding SPASM domain